MPRTAPMNITFPSIHITDESFVVQWHEVTDFFPISYNVQWYGEDGENGTATVSNPTHTVTNLSDNTLYSVTVVAINTCCGAGPVSMVARVMTNNESATPLGKIILLLCMHQ